MNGDDNTSDHTPEKTVSRRRKGSKMNRPRSASVAKSRSKTKQQQQQQQRNGSRMRGGGDGSNRNSGSSSAPLLHRGDSTTMTAANTSEGDPVTAKSNERKDDLRRLVDNTNTRGAVGSVAGDPPEATHGVDGASAHATQDAARLLLQQMKSRDQEIESRRRHLEHRCTELEGAELHSCFKLHAFAW